MGTSRCRSFPVEDIAVSQTPDGRTVEAFAAVFNSRAEVRDQAALTAMEQDESGVTVTTASGKEFRAGYLIGADGANSRVSRLVLSEALPSDAPAWA